MKTMGRICLGALLLIIMTIPAQSKAQDFGIKFSGFVKTDLMMDSRQTVNAREGHFLLYPAAEDNDPNGEDTNAQPNTNMLAIQTRLKGSITGPDAFGAKTSGVIEGAFFGHSNPDVNGFRLRHAFLQLAWTNNKLLVGQYWNPMFIPEVFAGVVSFNTGAPFQPFARNPQVRFIHTMGNVNLMAAAVSQRDFTSDGPSGASSIYLRNALMPILHAQLQYKTNIMVLGGGVDWKSLKPRLKTANSYLAKETVSGISFLGYAKFVASDVTVKVEGVLGENLTDLTMLGGYGIETYDPVTGVETYIPTQVLSVWTDLSTGKTVQYGLFVGFTQNQGADKNILAFWGRGRNIDTIYRVAPRVLWNSGSTRLACEVEYTAAAYGDMGPKGKVINSEYVNNLRLLLAAYYFF